MNDTAIEWADCTWNVVSGCTPVSDGCRNCWARRMAYRLRGRFGYPADEPFRVTLHPEKLEEPLKLRRPRRIFVCSMSDLFHPDVPDEFLDRVFAVMALCYLNSLQHTFLVLTKRPERMRDYICALHTNDVVLQHFRPDRGEGTWPPPNIWLGVTAENQAAADERIPILLQTPAAVRWVSCEPLLGLVDLKPWLCTVKCTRCGWYGRESDLVCTDDKHEDDCCPQCGSVDLMDADMYDDKLDWIVCGGETGPGARPTHPDWVRSLRDQCQTAGVPFHFKSWGDWAPIVGNVGIGVHKLKETREYAITRGDWTVKVWDKDCFSAKVGKKAAGRLLDGRIWDEYPEVRA